MTSFQERIRIQENKLWLIALITTDKCFHVCNINCVFYEYCVTNMITESKYNRQKLALIFYIDKYGEESLFEELL